VIHLFCSSNRKTPGGPEPSYNNVENCGGAVIIFTMAPVRHKICILFFEKSTSYLDHRAPILFENKIILVLNVVV
jgi:hypothetical protein